MIQGYKFASTKRESHLKREFPFQILKVIDEIFKTPGSFYILMKRKKDSLLRRGT